MYVCARACVHACMHVNEGTSVHMPMEAKGQQQVSFSFSLPY